MVEFSKEMFFLNLYRLSWIIVVGIGLLGMAVFLGQALLDSIDLESITGNIADNMDMISQLSIVLVVLFTVCLLIGWLQVAIISKIGEELILIVFWVTPFLLVAASLILVASTQEINYIGGAIIGIVMFALVVWQRKSIKLSARFVEMGSEIVVTRPSMFLPQLKSLGYRTLISIFMVFGALLLGAIGIYIHPIVSVILLIIYEFFYLFMTSVITQNANAHNLAYVNQWYNNTNKNPSYKEATSTVKSLKGPIARFAFLLTFLGWFKGRGRRTSGFTPFSLFKYMKLSSWPDLLNRILGGGTSSVASTAARVVEYLGSYTLVIIIVNKYNSVTQAFKESMSTVFQTFAANIAGSIGLNIVELFRKWFSILLLFGAGAGYGFLIVAVEDEDLIIKILIAIIVGFIFLIFGYSPLSAMFKPTVQAYQMVLYQGFTGVKKRKTISSRVDKKTQELMKEVFAKAK